MHTSVTSAVQVVTLLVLTYSSSSRFVNAFVVPIIPSNRSQIKQRQVRQLFSIHNYDNNEAHNNDGGLLEKNDSEKSSRRRFFQHLMVVGIGAVATINPLDQPPVALALEQPRPDDIIWMTGKMPIIPGQKPKDKSDVSGTRKDPNFLRSLSDCKNQCETMTGSNTGYAKGKEECLSECQDICCTTYQQCTFPIVQRI